MIELSSNEFKKIVSLIKNIEHNRALLYSVVESKNNGRVFVDDDINPKSAYIDGEFGFSFLVGNEHNDKFNNDITNFIFDDILVNTENKELVLFPCSKEWKTKLDKLLLNKEVKTIHRKIFKFNKSKYELFREKERCLPEGFHLKAINRKLVNQFRINEEILESSSRFGFVVVNEKDNISECSAIAVGGGEAEIDIMTNEKYRNKGFATIVAIAFIDYCLENNLIPNWSCWPFRKESIALAKKLGFEEQEDMPVIYWSADM